MRLKDERLGHVPGIAAKGGQLGSYPCCWCRVDDEAMARPERDGALYSHKRQLG
jgi:hypothetical protein